MSDLDDMHASREYKEAEMLNRRIADFMRKWRPDHPDDRREALEFEADLIGLIRAAHMQATEPFARRLRDCMKLQPMFPFPTPPEKKG